MVLLLNKGSTRKRSLVATIAGELFQDTHFYFLLDLERIKIMTTKKLFIGMEGIINWRWVQVEELTEDGTAIVVDQDGQDYEVTLGDFDHIY